MKQHITITDLKQLSDKGKERLRKWWKPSNGDLYFPVKRKTIGFDLTKIEEAKKFRKKVLGTHQIIDVVNFLHPYDVKREKSLPLLSIGQMIEFLEEKAKVEVRSHYTSLPVVEGQKEGCPLYDITGDGIEVEDRPVLCDALWEAVKEVLTKQE